MTTDEIKSNTQCSATKPTIPPANWERKFLFWLPIVSPVLIVGLCTWQWFRMFPNTFGLQGPLMSPDALYAPIDLSKPNQTASLEFDVLRYDQDKIPGLFTVTLNLKREQKADKNAQIILGSRIAPGAEPGHGRGADGINLDLNVVLENSEGVIQQQTVARPIRSGETRLPLIKYKLPPDTYWVKVTTTKEIPEGINLQFLLGIEQPPFSK